MQRSKPSKVPDRKVLLVDDVADMRMLIRVGISKILPEVQVHESESGMTAAVALLKNKFDLVISDLEMDNGNGFWLHCVMEDQHGETPLIFFTGKPDELQRLSHSRKVFSKDNIGGLLTEVAAVFDEVRLSTQHEHQCDSDKGDEK